MADISVATSQATSTLTAAQSNMSMERITNAARASQQSAAGANLDPKAMAKIDKTAQDFEAVFATEMMKPIFNTVKVDPKFGGGHGEEVFRDFMLNEYGKKIASQGGFGIAKQVKAQLIHLQEVSAGRAAATPATAAN